MNPTAPSAIVKRSVPITPERRETVKIEFFSFFVKCTCLYVLSANGAIIRNPRTCSKKMSVDGGSP